jgi:hypothetical protein
MLLAGTFGVAAANAQATFGPDLNAPTRALGAFARRLHEIRDYTTTDVTFEQLNDGSKVERRTYDYRTMNERGVDVTIVDGPGTGTVAAWRGSDTVKVHLGGSLPQIQLTLPIDDPRVQSLRGDTLDMGTFSYALRYMLTTPGTLTEAPGPTINGVPTTAVTLRVKGPAVAAVTKVVLDLSNATHLPVRRSEFVGSTIVKTETFSNTKSASGLGSADVG